MSITLLRTLIAVADTGSFALAASKVFVSQAAVGQQMRKLEADLGVVLFDRKGRSPKLNSVGEAVVVRARDVIERYDNLLQDLTPGDDLLGEITIGAIPSLISAMVPLAIRRLRERYPLLRTRVISGLTDELQDQVEHGAIDMAISAAPRLQRRGQKWQPFAEEKFVLIAGAEEQEDDPMTLLHGRPYIRHQRRTAGGLMAEEWLLKYAPRVETMMELQSLEALVTMVAHGHGVSVVPSACVPDANFAQLRQIALPGKPPVRQLGILTQTESAKSPLVDAMLTALVETVDAHGVSKAKL